MIGHYVLTLYRALARHRLYAALNVLGLAIGVAVFLVLMLFVQFQTSFERWIPNASDIYVVRSTYSFRGWSVPTLSSTMGALLEELKADFPQVQGVRVWDKTATIVEHGQASHEQLEVVDPNFLNVFRFKLLAGDRTTALSSPDSVVISEDVARKYFGSPTPLGRSLTISMDGAPQTFRVTGVLNRFPRATDLKADIVIPLTPALIQDKQAWSQWGLVQVTTWLELPSRQAAVGLQRALPAFIDRHGRTLGSVPHKVLRFDLAPLPSLHLIEHKDRLVVATLGLVGLVTLLIAAVNYVNLATARAGLRAREVAMRKVLGATRGVLVGQFLGEAVLTAAAAGVIGLAVAELVLPLVNAAGGLALEIDYVQGGRVLLAVGVVVLVVGVGAGLYPALSLSGFRPAAVLASARAPGGGRAGARMRELLVVAQFAIVIALAIATAVLFAQTRFLRTADLGFQRRGLIVVDSFADPALTRAQQSALLNLWRALPGVSGATVSDTAPGTEGVSGGANFRRPGETGTGPILRIVTTGPDFFRVYAARFLAGRALDQDHRLDGPVPPEQPGVAASRNVVLNLAAAKTLGFSKPSEAIGQTVFGEIPVGDKPQRSELEIVGVVQDFRFHSPREAVPPALYVFQPDAPDGAIAAVRFQAAEPQAVIAQMRTIWRQVAPNVPFEAKTAEANLSTYYRQDDQQTRLFTIGSVVAVAIGCLGLYGLSSFNTARRTKEIGIRKTLGASTADVLMLLLNQFLRPVLLANLIAWPVAYFAIRLWLSGFDQRITLSPLYFLVATLGALAIATFTVMGQTLKVAQSEPAKALRYE